MAVVEALWPESISIALKEIVPDADAEPAAAAFLERASRRPTLVQLIVYDPWEPERLDDLARRGVLPDGPQQVLAVLGRYSGTGGAEAGVDHFSAVGLSRAAWHLSALGPDE